MSCFRLRWSWSPSTHGYGPLRSQESLLDYYDSISLSSPTPSLPPPSPSPSLRPSPSTMEEGTCEPDLLLIQVTGAITITYYILLILKSFVLAKTLQKSFPKKVENSNV